MNHLIEYKHLSNRYFAMRHGHSIANLEGIIVSHPENGVNDYGLSKEGRAQVLNTMQANNQLDSKTLIVSSDFKRAQESAQIVYDLLKCQTPVCFELRLRERYFGELELSPDSSYADVWSEDETNPDSRLKGVESVNQVMKRMTELVSEYEKKITSATLLLVSHGDALQILQTAFLKQSGSSHRYQPHLETAEIRQMEIPKLM